MTRRSLDHLWQRIAVVASCLAVGTSASVGIVNHNAVVREDKNTCVIKAFLRAQELRTKQVGYPGATKAISTLHNLDMGLQAGHKCKA